MLGLITQREIKDTYGVSCDSLEKEYITYFESLGIELRCVSNFQNISIKGTDILILTGGGSINKDQPARDYIEKNLFKEAMRSNIPTIGICRGMQYINILLGGSVSEKAILKTPRPIRIDHDVNIKNDIIKVNNYHNDVIFENELAKELTVIAKDEQNNTIEAFYAKNILCVQWHPERAFEDNFSKEFSTNMILNFINNKGELDESCYISGR